MKPDWIDLGPLGEFPSGAPVLRKDRDGRRYACVREGDRVHAIDDRCPHQGYPLSQGTVRDGVLTCEWHNWKFETATGACTFGGEPVRCYPTRVEGGAVLVDRAVDRAAEARRLVAGLRAALVRDEPARALREGLRLGELGLAPRDAEGGLGALRVAFEVLARDGAERAEFGFDHGMALLADLCSWVERGWIGAEEAFVHGAHAIAEPSLHLGPRGAPRPGGAADARAGLGRVVELDASETAKVSEALIAERRDEAEARVREIVEARGPDGALQALTPFVARHLYDYGHGAIFVAKAAELARRFPAVGHEVLGAATVTLAWATAETSLPPFAATRGALARLAELPRGEAKRAPSWDRAAYESEVLAGETRAVQATLARLAEGCDEVALLRAVGHAAAVRLRRFDAAWERRLDAEVGVLDVTHAVTFVESAIALAAGADPPQAGGALPTVAGRRAGGPASGAERRHAAQLAVIAAGFVGKLRRADAAEPQAATAGASGDLLEAAEARDVGRALGVARGLDAGARMDAYRRLAPFAAFDVAVRPIFYAHTVKNTEALRRLEAGDPEADGVYLEALLAYLVPRRPEGRARRTAAVAQKFLRDGRPPEGLY